jgi:hypothetical protein
MRSFLPFRRLRRPFAALSLVLLGSVALGCFKVGDDDDDSSDDSCETDDDCRSTEFCNSDDECERKDTEPECERDSDCASTEVCNSSGECERAPANETPCTTLCDFFEACSPDPVTNCLSNCTTVLAAPPPCGTDFELYIECIDRLNGACSAATNCRDELELFSNSCGVEE